MRLTRIDDGRPSPPTSIALLLSHSYDPQGENHDV